MFPHHNGPFGIHIRIAIRSNCWKLVTVRRIALSRMDHIWFIKSFTISIHLAVAQVDTISWDSDNPLHHVHSRFLGMKENNNIAVLDLAVWNQRPHISRLRCGSQAIDKNVVSHQKSLDHGFRWDFKGLHHKRNDKETRNQDRRDPSNGFRQAFFFLFRFIPSGFNEQKQSLLRLWSDQRTSRNMRSQRAKSSKWASICPECMSLSLERPGSEPLTER